MEGNHSYKRWDNIVKSEQDKREYRGLLLNNEMKILLVSDSSTDKSAAAMEVNVGKDFQYLHNYVKYNSLLFLFFDQDTCVTPKIYQDLLTFVNTCFFWELRNIQWRMNIQDFSVNTVKIDNKMTR